jgi:hypothetical protein
MQNRDCKILSQAKSLRSLNISLLCSLACLFIIPSQTSASDRELSIHLRGKISERCEIEVIPLHGYKMDFSKRVENSASIKIDCNLPMTLNVRSQYGALIAVDDLQRNAKLIITNAVERQYHYRTYTTEVSITDIGFQIQASSRDLHKGLQFSTGSNIPFSTSGLLKVRLDAPLIYAGTYEDILHLEVSPSHGVGGI